MGLTGWYLHPVLLNLFWVVILIQIGVMVWGLRQTAAEGRTYRGQVEAVVLMSVFGGVIIFFGSLLRMAECPMKFPNFIRWMSLNREVLG